MTLCYEGKGGNAEDVGWPVGDEASSGGHFDDMI